MDHGLLRADGLSSSPRGEIGTARERARPQTSEPEATDPRRAPVDLTQCDREPIHVPGAIQGHGALVALREPELTVTHVSANVRELFGVDPTRAIGRPLGEVVSADGAAAISAGLCRPPLAAFSPLQVTAHGRSFEALLHRNAVTTILEFEPTHDTSAPQAVALSAVLARLAAASNLGELVSTATEEIWRLTGFDRVMAYRFHSDGHGEVIDERRSPDLEPYMGLHYPASDIPEQARRLYAVNWLRLIPDVEYVPVPLVPAAGHADGEPLDLTHASLRSVSPVHREYLRNMGVRASMSISVVGPERREHGGGSGSLRALFACHHREPRHVPFVVRSVCEVIGRLVSLQVAALNDLEADAQWSALRQPVAELVDAIRRDPGGWPSGLASKSALLLRVLSATGVAICDGDRILRFGATPEDADLATLIGWLRGRGEDLFETDALERSYPAARSYRDVASGVLAITLPKVTPSHVVWFRYEAPKTVTWGGDPSKPVEPTAHGGDGVRPRRSFGAWVELMRGTAVPWTRAEIDVARDLRRHAIEDDLGRNVARAEQAIRARDDMVATVSHDLKNPLSLISTTLVSMRKDSDHVRTQAMVDRVETAVSRMTTLISDLLDLARIEAGAFQIEPAPVAIAELLADVVALFAPLAQERGIALVKGGAPTVQVLGDRGRIQQVLSNIVGNAVKFTPGPGSVRIDAHAEDAAVRFSVSDTGPGIDPAERARIFNRYERSRDPKRKGGTGLGLYIAKGIVEAHGGCIGVEGAEGGGSTFSFTIPRA
jgi:light-regulated signal transduction histidine kinase (bacteriophytochrome)